jgi:Tfp pilus assembly protein PilX
MNPKRLVTSRHEQQPRTGTRARPGIALVVALGAVVVIGALVAGAYYSSLTEYRTGRSTSAEPRALAAAELGLNSVMSSWTQARTFALKVGADSTMADTTLSDGTVVSRSWKKVSPSAFWVVSRATAGGQNGQTRTQRRVGAIMHIAIPELKILGAVTSRGATSVSGNTAVMGTDMNPPGWDCPPPGSTAAALVVNDSATNATTTGGCGSAACLTGSPKIKDSTALVKDTTTYSNFGGFNYDSLTKLASLTFTTGTTFSQLGPKLTLLLACDLTNANNWGDTGRVALGLLPGPCEGYMPVVWLKGATQSWTLNGDGGQGILLVDGNIKFAGQFKWTGLVIVKGTVTTGGNGGNGNTGVKIYGALMAMNRGNGINTLAGTGQIQFSRCALQSVMSKYATAAPLKHRAWADLY